MRATSRQNANHLISVEINRYRAARAATDHGEAWRALERAHIIAQPFLLPHLTSHWRMLGFAIAMCEGRETAGQLFRLALVPFGSLIAEDQFRIAGDTARAATIRVQAGRASPLEQERAEVARVTAEAEVDKARRLAAAARANLARRIGRQISGSLDIAILGGPGGSMMGPPRPVSTAGTLALAAADADLATADAGVRLARSQRAPDLTVGPGVRRLEATNDVAAVFSVSLPLPLFNNGRASVDQANAERRRADAQRRATALNVEQQIGDAEVEAANAAAAARVASGPALSSAMEAARIARIGYREGKFGQLELLDAERTLTDMRVASIEALVSYQLAKARLERLTAPAPLEGN